MKSSVALFICLISLTVAAQQPAPTKAPPRPPAPPRRRSGAAPVAPPVPPAPPVDPEQGGQPINIRLDVSVIDQTAQGATQPKSLMVMLVDRAMGRTRAAFEDRSVAVDARPTIVDGRIRVSLTIQSESSRNNFPPADLRLPSGTTRSTGAIPSRCCSRTANRCLRWKRQTRSRSGRCRSK